jgi:hypothetical protein
MKFSRFKLQMQQIIMTLILAYFLLITFYLLLCKATDAQMFFCVRLPQMHRCYFDTDFR